MKLQQYRQVFNVYCDESCHLKHDNQAVMTLGAVWCSLEKTSEIATRLREIKEQHNLPKDFEIKWVWLPNSTKNANSSRSMKPLKKLEPPRRAAPLLFLRVVDELSIV